MSTIKEIIKYYGKHNQKLKAVEEMAELIKEIMNDISNRGNFENILDEIADVYIMTDQLKHIYNIDDKQLMDKVDEKLNRTINRINKERTKDICDLCDKKATLFSHRSNGKSIKYCNSHVVKKIKKVELND